MEHSKPEPENPARTHPHYSTHDPTPKEVSENVTNGDKNQNADPDGRIQIPIRIESGSSQTVTNSGSGESGYRGSESVTENDTGGSGAANASQFSLKDTMDSVKDVLERWGKKVGEATKKAEDLAGNTWQYLKTGPSVADAAMGRIAQGAKILAEGGYEKIFRQTFDTEPEEQLQNTYACYLSTSAGPVMGTLYVTTEKLAYCSDSPLSYKAGDRTEWSYYKVVIPLHQLKAINPSSSGVNSAEKYIQIISVDSHEFWFMGFLDYEGAVTTLQLALEQQNLESV